MTKNAINGAATIGTPILPPAVATWEVDLETKTSSTTILTGTAVISRRVERTDTDSGLFGEYKMPLPEDEEGNPHFYKLTTNLGQYATVSAAQAAFEMTIRDHLSKARPDLLEEKVALENAEMHGSAQDDPF